MLKQESVGENSGKILISAGLNLKDLRKKAEGQTRPVDLGGKKVNKK